MSTIYRPRKRIYLPNDPFFEEGNIALRAIWLQKEAQSDSELDIIEQEANDLTNQYTTQIYCDGCRTEFPNVLAYELHYEAVHRNVCSVCHKIFPGSEWLQLHLDELHDVILQMKKAKGEKIHKCYVETCKKSFSTPRMRRLHLIDKHQYPKYFPFDIVYTGTLTLEQKRQRDQKNKARLKKIKEQQSNLSVQQEVKDVDMDELTSSLSKLKLPKTISFGHSRQRALPRRSPRHLSSAKEQQDLVDVEMKETSLGVRKPRKRGPKKKKQELMTS